MSTIKSLVTTKIFSPMARRKQRRRTFSSHEDARFTISKLERSPKELISLSQPCSKRAVYRWWCNPSPPNCRMNRFALSPWPPGLRTCMLSFFSDWFYGLPATALEQRTWEEVRDLSLNFFLVSPILHLPFAPVVHPMLEDVFNLLLSWAALFAGFLSDDRPNKPNVLPMLPTVAGMQFLTSAFLLPYLVTRSNEQDDGVVYMEDLGQVAQITESRFFGTLF